MPQMTYATLVSRIKAYLERDDETTDAEIPYAIALAETRCARELKTLLTIATVTSQFQAGQAVYQKPARWLEAVSFNYGTGATATAIQRTTLYNRSYDYLRAYWPNSSETSAPLYYGDYSYTNWIVAPTPDDNYPFEVRYYQRPESLSASNQSNWFTEYAPDLLLYAALLEMTPFLKVDDRIQTWQAMYDRALQALGVQQQRRVGDAQAIGGAR